MCIMLLKFSFSLLMPADVDFVVCWNFSVKQESSTTNAQKWEEKQENELKICCFSLQKKKQKNKNKEVNFKRS